MAGIAPTITREWLAGAVQPLDIRYSVVRAFSSNGIHERSLRTCIEMRLRAANDGASGFHQPLNIEKGEGKKLSTSG